MRSRWKALVIAGALFVAACSPTYTALKTCPIACTDGNGLIAIREEVLEEYRDQPDVLFLIVAHEVGHNMLGHRSTGGGSQEFEADDFAVSMTKLRPDPCAIVPVLRRYDQPVRAAKIKKENNCK
jgi:hypothetical protein